MADATTVFIAKIAAARTATNTDATTAVAKTIPTWRATNTDVNTAIRDAP